MGDGIPLPFMTRDVRTHQRGICNFYASVDGSAVAGGTDTTNGLDTAAKAHMTVTENSDGNYSFTLLNPGQRFAAIHATGITADTNCNVSVDTEGKTCTVVQTTADTGAVIADADFYLTMAVQYAADAT